MSGYMATVIAGSMTSADNENDQTQTKMQNIQDICSQPEVSDENLQQLAEFQYSFGYECQKYFNLAMIEETLIFSSGNLIHLLNTANGTMTFRRSIGGRGIGHIAVNPIEANVAVGEKGDMPNIYIYSWPSFDVVSVLKNGTQASYIYLDYSSDGELLCSQGSAPDFTLVLWNWRKAEVLLECCSSSQEVFRAAFSRLQPDQLVTCGLNHIKFWRTAKTFTGLKLVSESGRFGKTEMTDIAGFEALEGDKVASGCSWGNILVWSNGAVEYEITTRRESACHTAPILTFDRCGNWLVSIGMDGWVRVWDYLSPSVSRCVQDDRVLHRQESIIYFSVGEHSCLMSKVDQPGIKGKVWFLQDGYGAIWRTDVTKALQGEDVAPDSKCMLMCHSRAVVAMATSPHAPRLATLGQDGTLFIHDYLIPRQAYLKREFKIEGSALLWLPLEVDQTGSRLVVSFANGSVVLCVVLWDQAEVKQVQSCRPHEGPVTVSRVSPSGRTLTTGGRDCTVFILSILQEPTLSLQPQGFVVVPSPVVSLDWRHSENQVLLVCCERGEILELTITEEAQPVPSSYQLDITPLRVLDIKTLTQQLRSLSDMGEVFTPNTQKIQKQEVILVLMGRYYDNDTVMVLLCGHPKCRVLQCRLDTGQIASVSLISGVEQSPVTSATFTARGQCAVLGFKSGHVQVSLLGGTLPYSWDRFWRLAMHDNDHGEVTGVSLSYDQRHFFSCGRDGNVFAYTLSKDVDEPLDCAQTVVEPDMVEERPGTGARGLTLSLEQVRQAREEKRRKVQARSKKTELAHQLHDLRERYLALVDKADMLPPSLQLGEDAWKLNPSVTAHLSDEATTLRSEMLAEVLPRVAKSDETWARVHNHFLGTLEVDSLFVFAFSEECFVQSYRLKKLDPELWNTFKDIELKLIQESKTKSFSDSESGSFLQSQASEDSCLLEIKQKFESKKSSLKTTQVLERLRQRRLQRKHRLAQLEQLIASKPSEEPNPELYEGKVREAENNIGDYKLKCDPNYVVPPELRVTTLKARHELIEVKLQVHSLKKKFNSEVFTLRKKKTRIIELYSSEDSKNILQLRDLENTEKDLLKLCDGPGSQGKTSIDESGESGECFIVTPSIDDAIVQFDAEVRAVSESRVSLDVTLSLLELQAVSLHQELLVLTEFEPRERALEERLMVTREDKAKLQGSLAAINEKIREQKKVVAQTSGKEREITQRFFSEAEESSYYEPLMMLFKTSYHPPSLSTGSSCMETSTSLDSDTSSEDNTDAHTGSSRVKKMNERVCPPGCDAALFDLTNSLRVQRYENQLKVAEERKYLDLMVKDQEIVLKKIKLVNNAMRGIFEEIETFQRERQRRLNALRVAVPLRLHQLPAGTRISECVVLANVGLDVLRGRAGQLRTEAATLELKLTQDKKNFKAIKQQCASIESSISDLKSKIKDTKMFKRFGKEVDMEELETAVLGSDPNSTTFYLSEMDKQRKRELAVIEAQLSKVKSSLINSTQEKTERTLLLASLLKEKNDINRQKVNKHERCNREDADKCELAVRRLHEIMTSQREQIGGLRHELEMLRCKMTSSRELFIGARDEEDDTPDPSSSKASRGSKHKSSMSSKSKSKISGHRGDSEATSGEQTPPRTIMNVITMAEVAKALASAVTPEILIEHCETSPKEEKEEGNVAKNDADGGNGLVLDDDAYDCEGEDDSDDDASNDVNDESNNGEERDGNSNNAAKSDDIEAGEKDVSDDESIDGAKDDVDANGSDAGADNSTDEMEDDAALIEEIDGSGDDQDATDGTGVDDNEGSNEADIDSTYDECEATQNTQTNPE